MSSEKTKFIFMSHRQNARQNHNLMLGNKTFENVAKFRYFGTAVTNENSIREEIKSRLNSVNAYSCLPVSYLKI